MIRPVIRDTFFLSRKSVPADAGDINTVIDLTDTLRANRNRCVGMAANMIGVNKRIIVCDISGMITVMLNPVITKKTGAYETKEGCLSLDGERNVTRYHEITVSFDTVQMKKKTMRLKDFSAQIVQHECDHLEGIII